MIGRANGEGQTASNPPPHSSRGQVASSSPNRLPRATINPQILGDHMTDKITIATPLTLPCGAVLKNRIIKAAMTEGLGDPQNRATQSHERLYRRWAEGGAGVLLTGNVQVDRRYMERPGNVAIDGPQSNEAIAALRAYAKAGTANNTHLWMQISHAGRQTPIAVSAEPLAPSDIPLDMPGAQFGKPRAMTGAEIEDVIVRFAHTASVARDVGFTGVQIHGAHGYLISEFLSPDVTHAQTSGAVVSKTAHACCLKCAHRPRPIL